MAQQLQLPPPPETVPAPVPPSTTLPLWQRRIVALVQSGVPIRDAADQQRVSWASIDLYTRSSPAFAQAIADAEAGVAIMGVEETRSLAVAHVAGLVVDAVEASRKAPHERDRVLNRRYVSDAGGVTGPATAAQGTVQISAAHISMLVLNMTLEERLALVARGRTQGVLPVLATENKESL